MRGSTCLAVSQLPSCMGAGCVEAVYDSGFRSFGLLQHLLPGKLEGEACGVNAATDVNEHADSAGTYI